jgi:hypothetical protein
MGVVELCADLSITLLAMGLEHLYLFELNGCAMTWSCWLSDGWTPGTISDAPHLRNSAIESYAAKCLVVLLVTYHLRTDIQKGGIEHSACP